MWVLVGRFEEHRGRNRMINGWVCVEEEVGWFEDLLLIVKVDVCECGEVFFE